ncbi:hypothetical protein F5Y09DRAFT_338700 [Xylaria sp. FL1042]|nr:hypothetical protein F5Y09DRAFT_338700 [Xylaria sp. FL1042]
MSFAIVHLTSDVAGILPTNLYSVNLLSAYIGLSKDVPCIRAYDSKYEGDQSYISSLGLAYNTDIAAAQGTDTV